MNRTRRKYCDGRSVAERTLDLQCDFAAMRESRFRMRRSGLLPTGASGDYHYRYEHRYFELIELARDMDRNDAVLGPAVNRATWNTVQNGFGLDPQTGSPEIDAILEELWAEWADDPKACDSAGSMSFPAMQEAVFRAVLVDGDIFALLLDDGRIQLLEAHRCRSPGTTLGERGGPSIWQRARRLFWPSRNGQEIEDSQAEEEAPAATIVHGVELDELRRKVAFWFTAQDYGIGATTAAPPRRIPAEIEEQPVVLHVADPRRITQTRGVTAFAPVLDLADMLQSAVHAKLVQQVVASAIVFVRKAALGSVPTAPGQMGERTAETLSEGGTLYIEDIRPGMILDVDPGGDISPFSANVPNPEYFEHVRSLLQLIGLNLGLPLIAMLMDASETNFSGWRGAMDQARVGFLRNQRWLREKFLEPVRRWKIRQWMQEIPVLRAYYEARGSDLFRCRWNAPRWPYIQPLQDAQADDFRISRRLSSPRRVAAERGADYWEIAEEAVADHEYEYSLAIEAARRLRERYGVTIDPMKLLDPTATEPLLSGADEAAAGKPSVAARGEA